MEQKRFARYPKLALTLCVALLLSVIATLVYTKLAFPYPYTTVDYEFFGTTIRTKSADAWIFIGEIYFDVGHHQQIFILQSGSITDGGRAYANGLLAFASNNWNTPTSNAFATLCLGWFILFITALLTFLQTIKYRQWKWALLILGSTLAFIFVGPLTSNVYTTPQSPLLALALIVDILVFSSMPLLFTLRGPNYTPFKEAPKI